MTQESIVLQDLKEESVIAASASATRDLMGPVVAAH